ncbi:MAG: alpha/beta fold hydrolase [Candidatus Latescibacteria bacterium]|nr:alpha/beta fold hydrolase [Candidatus Latescibacterota bacterium]
MPSLTINGAAIEYELFGTGPLLVWTEGGRFGRSEWGYLLAGHFSRQYSVLIWDRRNGFGASDVALADSPNYITTDVEDLHALLDNLGLGPACFAGASAGGSLSLWMAHLYPDAVKSLILFWAPTWNTALFRPGVEKYCFSLADIAEDKGMQAAIDTSTRSWMGELQGQPRQQDTWLAQTIHRNPGNRARILALDPQVFAATTRRWGQFILSMSWPAGLAKDAVRSLPFPAVVVPGDDEIHPRQSAERLQSLLNQAAIIDYPETVGAEASEIEKFYSIFPKLDEFLGRTLFD